ncbi:hypothetical protein [Thomasclavelia spiroformis]|jgi:hypothetical protein|uniref:hypothetical protein n=1 Tax=Thomasclavelia spiroformis TaxID=29348 RepID=UPI00241F2575|nr:hypothetical protein [Thomasclavelia spiroformis]
MIIDSANLILSEKFIKELHLVLKNKTKDFKKDWFAVGDYKKLPNKIGGRMTNLPEAVVNKMKELLSKYNTIKEKNIGRYIKISCGV